MKKLTIILLSGIFLSFCSIVLAEETAIDGTAVIEEKPVVKVMVYRMGVAEIGGTTEGSEISGGVTLTETPEGLAVVVELVNVPTPGKHGFHIHENGSCADAGSAAGGHFNPMTVDHGFLPKDGHEHAHGGDMGNIEIDKNGHGTLSLVMPDIKLDDVVGKAIILHEKEDDFGQPTGNAGGRIGCGLIVLPENMENGGK